ncbi:MAG TPA: hypothetical protein VEU55_01275 [Gemmatimonadales bacterium]|nr:hypothetical protein [Gemmatimonadales bacterium]
MTNPLQNNYLVRGVWCLAAVTSLGGCGAHHAAGPAPTAALPTAGLAAQQVSVLPLTLLAAEDSLHWERALGERRVALAKADSVLGTLLKTRAPEVTWVLPEELRRAARRAPGIAPDPDQMGTAVLFHAEKVEIVPDPLRSELRTLTALAGSGGGRYALLPAGLVFRRTSAPATGAAAPVPAAPGHGAGTAELTVVMVDVRTGRVGFRTVARGEGDDPWTALTRAVKSLTPGLP